MHITQYQICRLVFQGSQKLVQQRFRWKNVLYIVKFLLYYGFQDWLRWLSLDQFRISAATSSFKGYHEVSNVCWVGCLTSKSFSFLLSKLLILQVMTLHPCSGMIFFLIWSLRRENCNTKVLCVSLGTTLHQLCYQSLSKSNRLTFLRSF